MPAGYELTTLVHGIVEAGRAAPSVSELTRERLQELQHDVKVDVYVTPT
jgi:alkyl hydroperoxide reductase subunit AhpF